MPDFIFNDIYEPIFSTKARYIDVWGGRGRGGSHFLTDYFNFLITKPNYFRGYFMREIFGDIRGSLFRDFKDRLEENDTLDENDYNINESQMNIIYNPTDNTITSKGFRKSSGKRTANLKSIAGATHVGIEECEEVSFEDFDKLDDSLRTVKSDIQIIRLFNPPPKDHWLIRNYYNLLPCDDEIFNDSRLSDKKNQFFKAVPLGVEDHLSIFSTYKSNIKNINKSTLDKIERIRNQVTDSDYYLNYYLVTYLGYVPTNDIGLIYPDWRITNEYPHEDEVLCYWCDWGFSNDPTAIGELKKKSGQLWVKELVYETGLTSSINVDNPQQKSIEQALIANNISKDAYIIADGAEPKDIRELRILGYNVYPAPKGKGSVISGINLLKQFIVNIEENSVNIIMERDRYKWKEHSMTGDLINEPIKAFDHHMDGIRGCLLWLRKTGMI